MTAKLNQIIAIEKGIKAKATSDVNALYKAIQKPELFNGFSKTYQDKDESGEVLPPEGKRVQYEVKTVLREIETAMTDHFNITARKDFTNCVAKADVVIQLDDQDVTLIKDAPVSFLLFLEKQLTDLRTMIGKLPVLDEAEDWSLDPNSGLYRTAVTSTHRTKKTQKPIVLYPATPEHPAQTAMLTEDVIAGFWSLTKRSGAISKIKVGALLDRVEGLLQAVKKARETANMQDEIQVTDIGGAVFGYLFEAS